MSNKVATRQQERELTAWIIRKFPEGQIPADQAQYLIEHSEELPSLLLTMISRGNITTPVQLQATVTEWQKLFGHLRMWDSNFKESNFPLVDDGDEAEEVCLNKVLTGHQALEEFATLKREAASLGAQGRYIKAHPTAQKERPLLGVGAQWQDVDDVWFPVFFWDGGQPGVDLNALDYWFHADFHWLLRKAKA